MPAAPGVAPPRRRAPAPWTWLDWVTLGCVIAPFVVGAVVVLVGSAGHLPPVADNAINELRVGDLGRYAVLVGPYSRDGWNHPGPALYYALWAPYRLSGSRPGSLLFAAACLNAVSAGGMVFLARRLAGRTAMLLTAIAVLVCTFSLGAGIFVDPWNPSVTILPFGAVMVAAWGTAAGRPWFLPALVGAATFCVQSHVLYAPVIAPVALTAVAIGAVTARRRGTQVLTAVAVSGLLLVAMWLPTAIDQFGRTGNVTTIVHYFDRGQPTAGPVKAARIVGADFALDAPWLTGFDTTTITGEPRSATSTPIPVLGIVAVAVAAITWRRLSRHIRLAALLLLVALAATLVATARTPGAVFQYRLGFLALLGALTAATTVGIVMAFARARPRADLALLAIAGVLAVALGVAFLRPAVPQELQSRRLRAMAPRLLASVASAREPVVIRSDSFGAWLYEGGVALELERAGDRVVVRGREHRLTFGAHRAARSRRSPVYTIVVGPAIARYDRDPHQTRVTSWQAEPARRRNADLAELRRLALRGSQATAAERARIARLLLRTDAVAIFRSEPAAPGP